MNEMKSSNIMFSLYFIYFITIVDTPNSKHVPLILVPAAHATWGDIRQMQAWWIFDAGTKSELVPVIPIQSKKLF